MKVLVVGAGGHARVVLDILRRLGHEIVGIIDDDTAKVGEDVGGYEVIGTTARLAGLRSDGYANRAIVAIGDNESRMIMARRLETLRYEMISAVDPSAILGSRVTLGRGSVIMAGVVVNCDSSIGDHAIINTGATVDHDGVISDGCHISPGVHIAGHVEIGKMSHIGTGAAVIPNVRVGECSVVGGGSVVICDVPDNGRWAGNPARPIRSSTH